MYTPKLTYPVYDLNSSMFVGVIKDILEAEFNNQINSYGNVFLPTTVKTDEYLLNPIADKEINPSFVSIIKAKMNSTEYRFADHQKELNNYIIGVLANGLLSLRKISDAIYEILTDMDVKNYLFTYEVSDGQKLISNTGEYYVSGLASDYEVSKTVNDQNIIYGYLTLNAEILEMPKLNTHTGILGVDTEIQIGEDKKSIKQTINYT